MNTAHAPFPIPSLLLPEGGPDSKSQGRLPKTNGHARPDQGTSGVILLVDDSEQDQMLISAALGELGLAGSLRWAGTADAAIAYFQGRPPFDDRFKNPVPALVLLDIQLLKDDGFSVLSWLRSQGAAWHRVPVVMLTTSNRQDEVVRAYDLGANSFLVKPTGFNDLCTLLKSATDYWLKKNKKS